MPAINIKTASSHCFFPAYWDYKLPVFYCWFNFLLSALLLKKHSSWVIKNLIDDSQIPSLNAILVVLKALPISLRRLYQSFMTSAEGTFPVFSFNSVRIKLYSANITKVYWKTLTALEKLSLPFNRLITLSSKNVIFAGVVYTDATFNFSVLIAGGAADEILTFSFISLLFSDDITWNIC